MFGPSVRRLCSACAVTVTFFAVGRSEDAARQAPDAERAAAKILETRCLSCHGDDARRNGLDLRTAAAAVAGGKHGPAVVPGEPDKSLLLRVIRHEAEPHMPPDEPPLPADEVAALAEWVQGLPTDLSPEKTHTPVVDLPEGLDTTGAIDRLVEAGWQARGVTAAPPCDDRTFVRRVHLDLVGEIPTPAETAAFLSDAAADKRARLVDALLADRRHARHLAEVFDAVLLGRGDDRSYRRRREAGWPAYLEAVFRENRPWDQVARQVLLARPEGEADEAAVWFLYARRDKHQEIAEAVAPAFFGVRVECAQCHDHPVVPEIEQAHYWGLVAFFNRGKNVDTPLGPRVAESAVGGFSQFKNLEGEAKENLLAFLDVSVVDEMRDGERKDADDLYRPDAEPKAPRIPLFSRRERFVDQVLARHPRVARAFVNRAWALLLGRGIVHPVDEMDSVHPPSHPQLLDRLAADFERSGYDMRKLLRAIVLSRPYQLAAGPADPAAQADAFAFAADRPLIAEAYARSLAVAAGGVSGEETEKLVAETRAVFPDVFPRENVATLAQALFVSNRPAFQSLAAARPGSTAERMLAANDHPARAAIAFEAAFGRAPDDEEQAAAVAFLESRRDRPADGVAQLLWALLSSAEFRFNH